MNIESFTKPRTQRALRLGVRAALGGMLLAALSLQAPIAAAAGLNLGMVDSSPSKMSKRFAPLLEYLTSKGVETGKVVTTSSMTEMAERINAGEVDIMFESPYGAIQVMEATNASPILIREKSGVKQYNSAIFVKADSDIKRLADLKGKVIAFEDVDSTSSFHLPSSLLTGVGLELVESRKPTPGKIAYYFTKDDDNTVVQVKAGRSAQAGGIKTSKVKGNPAFRVLQPESVFVPRHVVLVRSGVDSTQLKKVLLGMKQDPNAKAVLEKIKTPTGFSEFEGEPVSVMAEVKTAIGL